MKISLKVLAFLIPMCSSIFSIRAQVIQGALIGGINATQVDGDEVYGYHKYGFNLGAAAIVPYNKKWSFSLETLFNQKGSYQAPIYEQPKTGQYKLILNYLEVPVLVHFTDKERITAGAGFSWGRLVSVKEWEHGIRDTATTLTGGPYHRNDWDVLLDLRFRIYNRLKFNFRYAYSMAKIRDRHFNNTLAEWDRKQYNNVLTFRLMYVINEKIADKNKKKQ